MSVNVNNPKCVIDGSCKFLRAVEEAFFLLDRDQNRLINVDDFITVAKSVGIELDANEASALIQTAIREQTDNQMQENELTAEQFAEIMRRHIGPMELNDELRQTFDAFDRNHDGRITREDFDKLRYEETIFDQLDDEQYELILKELSNLDNQNRGIDFNQFVNLMMNQ